MRFVECPRCHRQTLRADKNMFNALSRRDGKTWICLDCGNEEAEIDYCQKVPDQVETDFLEILKKQKGVKSQ